MIDSSSRRNMECHIHSMLIIVEQEGRAETDGPVASFSFHLSSLPIEQHQVEMERSNCALSPRRSGRSDYAR